MRIVAERIEETEPAPDLEERLLVMRADLLEHLRTAPYLEPGNLQLTANVQLVLMALRDGAAVNDTAD